MQARVCPANVVSALGMTLTAPPHSLQVSISILNTRFRRCAFMPLGTIHRDMAFREWLFRRFIHLKAELVWRINFKTREQAERIINDYIMNFYNRKRRHTSLGNISPMMYEKIAA